MFRIALFALLTLFASGCTVNGDWSQRDTARQYAITGLMVVDAMQTANIQHHPAIVEGGTVARHVLGRDPSSAATYQYFATLIASHYIIARLLPEEARPYYQTAVLLDHGTSVFKNCKRELTCFAN